MKNLIKWSALLFILSGKAFSNVSFDLSDDFKDFKVSSETASKNKLMSSVTSPIKKSELAIPVKVDADKGSDVAKKLEKSSRLNRRTIPLDDEKPSTIQPLSMDDNFDKEFSIEGENNPTDDIDLDGTKLSFSNNVEGDKDNNKSVKSLSGDKDNQKKSIKLDDDKDIKEFAKKPNKKKDRNVLYQDPAFIDDHEDIIFNFEDTDLTNVAKYIESIHKVKFITEDVISPKKDAKGLGGHKISFRTNKALTKRESWDLFVTFLHIAGLDIVPMTQVGFFKVVPFTKANSEAIPTYIGTNFEILPDNEMIVRYLYFVKNIDPAKLKNILKQMQAGSAKLDVFSDLKALIFTDRSCNIKSLMQIVSELDKSIAPETLSVIRLKRANVEDVKTIYQSLKPGGGNSIQPQRAWLPGKKEQVSEYFPQDVTLISDKRTNSLILLGPEEGVKKIEEFVQKYIDIDANRGAPPVFTYYLDYTNATDIAVLLNNIVTYGGGNGVVSPQYGGVRDGVKYFSKVNIVPEPHSNSLIINAMKDDYEALLPLIKELDVQQKQVGIEVLFVEVADAGKKVLGSQLSSPKNINSGEQSVFIGNLPAAQTSGIMNSTGSLASAPVISNNSLTEGEEHSIRSSLAALLGGGIGAVNETGSILITFGKPIWALFKILKTMTSVNIVSNPFTVVSNNSPATINVGEQRKVRSTAAYRANNEFVTIGKTTSDSFVGFTITPQINKENIVNLSINIQNDRFTVSDRDSGTKDKKMIKTYASVGNGEVLVIGGLMQESSTETTNGVPFLENIPVLGWLFKSKVKSTEKRHFLTFISPRVIEAPQVKGKVDKYTEYKMRSIEKNIELMDDLDWFSSKKDPIQEKFFGPNNSKTLREFIGKKEESRAIKQYKEGRSEKRKRLKQARLDKKLAKKGSKKRFKKNKKNKSVKLKLEEDFIDKGKKKLIKNQLSKSTIAGSKNV